MEGFIFFGPHDPHPPHRFFPQFNGIFSEFLFLGKSLNPLLERFMRAMRGMRAFKNERRVFEDHMKRF